MPALVKVFSGQFVHPAVGPGLYFQFSKVSGGIHLCCRRDRKSPPVLVATGSVALSDQMLLRAFRSAMRLLTNPRRPIMKEYGLYMGGEWRKSAAAKMFVTQNPANGEDLAFFVGGRAEDVDLAVEAATRAFPAWKNYPPPRRGKFCLEPQQSCGDEKTNSEAKTHRSSWTTPISIWRSRGLSSAHSAPPGKDTRPPAG